MLPLWLSYSWAYCAALGLLTIEGDLPSLDNYLLCNEWCWVEIDVRNNIWALWAKIPLPSNCLSRLLIYTSDQSIIYHLPLTKSLYLYFRPSLYIQCKCPSALLINLHTGRFCFFIIFLCSHPWVQLNAASVFFGPINTLSWTTCKPGPSFLLLCSTHHKESLWSD